MRSTYLNPGIYLIRNTYNGKIYVGSTKQLAYRFKRHVTQLKHQKHPNAHLQAAWNKYGEAKFMFEVLEPVEVDNLAIREGYWMTYYKSCNRSYGYNITTLDENGRTKHSEATKIKIGISNRGKVYSAESRQKISNSHKGKQVSKESVAKMVNTKCKVIYDFTHVETGTRFIGRRLKEFAKNYGLYPTTLYRVNSGKAKQHKGWYATASLQNNENGNN